MANLWQRSSSSDVPAHAENSAARRTWSVWLRAAVIVGAVAFFVAFAAMYEWLPWWMDGSRLRALSANDQISALANDRDDFLKIVAGAAGLVALIYTIRRHNLDRQTLRATQQSVRDTEKRDAETVRLATEGQITDRYIKAIGLLAGDRPDERLGGIYALERIMIDSPRDEPTIVEVLAAFVRRVSPWPAPASLQQATQPGPAIPLPTQDVSAAVTVLARRPKRETLHPVDLRRTNLAGIELPQGSSLARADLRAANLTEAQLGGVDLHEANLTSSDLTRANLRFADLHGARLPGAVLVEANLSRANLGRANLTGADLRGADLYRAGAGARARFDGAILVEANLVRTNLEGASMRAANLSGARLTNARLDSTVMSDADLTRAEIFKSLIEIGGQKMGPAHATFLDGAILDETDISPVVLSGAYITDATRLPAALASDPWIRARIADCARWASTYTADGRSLPTDLEGLAPTPEPAPAPLGTS